ncbi:nucleotidyltransferase domain-containing protein [Candidatus Bathyarchaeota archaeon]|nr:nucleotidyltransferase domain-containing protein [Candidatus Bathyarchaeota archaeon]
MSLFSLEEQIKVIAQIKNELDREFNGRLLNLMISGSHLYGFESKDSDVDWRGYFLTGTENLLGINKPRDILELEPDIVIYEIQKETELAIKGNCNALERFNAKPVHSTGEHRSLLKLVNNTYGKIGLYNSYRGMAYQNFKKFILQGKKTYKKYLYVYRGIMAGTHALETGRIQPNIVDLLKYWKIPEVKTVLEYKKQGAENVEVQGLIDSGELDSIIPEMFERMDRAFDRSKLREYPDPDLIDEINKFIIQLRTDKIGR